MRIRFDFESVKLFSVPRFCTLHQPGEWEKKTIQNQKEISSLVVFVELKDKKF